MAPEFGVDELPLTNDNIIESKEMESEDIEDGEILEDESNQGEEAGNPTVTNDPPDEKNNFERFFPKEKKVHHHHHHRPHDHPESHKSFRRDRSSFSGEKKRKSSDEDAFRREKYYGKKSKRNETEDDNDEDMIFMLGGSLRDVEQKPKTKKSSVTKEKLDPIPDHMMFNEGENEDPRPYARRSPSERREKIKKDRGILVRGVGGNLMKRRGGRGGPVSRKEKPREPNNDACLYFAQGKCQRGNDCPYLHAYNQPRKLEICKFYLNDCCNKRDKCIYMHSDFPCKYFHMPGLTCSLGAKCKFSHSKLDEVQRAVLKKYADVPIKEVDEAQRFFREVGNSNSRTKEKKDLRIPSLLNLRVSVPPEYREGKETEEGDGVTTPIPSPESMAYENNESDEVPHKHHHKRKKPTAELNNHDQNFLGDNEEEIEPSEVELVSKHKKRSRKSDESNEGERSRKHGDKKRKKSKKDDKDGERAEKKKKKKEHKRHKIENGEDIFSAENQSFNEDSFEVNTDEKLEREPDDAFAHLPKKQQELFLRIQQHQKEADISQSANMDKTSEEDDGKVDLNWYSSDEEETPEPVQETVSPLATSPLATLLRTIRTSSCRNDVPYTEDQIDTIPTSSNLFSTSADSTENESVPIVDASQLANIDLSDDITKILSSIMKTDAASSHSDTISNSLPLDSERGNDRFSASSTIMRTPFPTSDLDRMTPVPPRKPSAEEIGLIFRSTALFGSANTNHTSSDTVPKDIDLRQLPFKPVPVHDAANEIDASITSHPPMEYKLKPLPPIPKVNYASMIDTAKVCANDPRFKKVEPDPAVEPTVDLISKLTDPRFEFKLPSEPVVRVDPRIRNDPRLAAGKNVPAMSVAPKIFPVKADPRVEKESARFADSRDPRLLSCNKFPQDGPYPFQMAAVAAAASLPQSVMPAAASVPMLMTREPTPLRKEDPRLRYRANHKV